MMGLGMGRARISEGDRCLRATSVVVMTGACSCLWSMESRRLKQRISHPVVESRNIIGLGLYLLVRGIALWSVRQ